MSVDYKYKPEKHKFRVNTKTIDELHKENLENFKRQRETLPMKKVRLESLEKELLELIEDHQSDKHPINLNMDFVKRRNQIKRTIYQLKEEIKRAENCIDELEYYSRAGDVIYDYYDVTNGILYGKNFEDEHNKLESQNREIEEAKKKIEISEDLMAITDSNKKLKLKRPVRKRNKKLETTPTKGIMSYLLGSEDEEDEEDEQNKKCRATLQNEYLLMMDKEYACSKSKPNLSKKCKKCGKDKEIIYAESIVSCPICGEYEPIFIESDMPSQRETFTEKPKYPYKKLQHCIEKLNQFLCKGSINVPHEVMATMEDEIKKHGMNRKEVTIKFLEKMLKKHRMSDHYENIMYIYTKISGTPPVTISREEYELVLKMFSEAEDVYDRLFKPDDRTNFLKYTFVLNKIFLTIDRKDIAQYFNLLKSTVKMKEQEHIWSKICNELGWRYRPS